MPHPSRLSLEAIVETARVVLEEGGAELVGMREVARRLDVRAPSLYLYVESRADLLSRLIERGFEGLGEALAGSAVEEEPVRATLHRQAGAYIGFAMGNPALFDLMLGPCPEGVSVDPGPGERASSSLLAAVSALEGGTDPLAVSQIFWSLVHGVTTLTIAGQFRMGGDPEAAMHLAIDLLVDSLGRREGANPGSRDDSAAG